MLELQFAEITCKLQQLTSPTNPPFCFKIQNGLHSCGLLFIELLVHACKSLIVLQGLVSPMCNDGITNGGHDRTNQISRMLSIG